MTAQNVVMTINDKFSFWRIFDFDEKHLITYEQLCSLFVDELQIYIKNKRPDLNIDMEQISMSKASLYMLNNRDVSRQSLIDRVKSTIALNCELLVKFESLNFNTNTANDSPSTKYTFPTVSEYEASDLVSKAQNASSISLRTSLNFYESASKYSLFEYAEELYNQKKWGKLYEMIGVLKEKYPQNTKVSLMVAKCYESLNDNVHAFQTYKEALIFSDDPSLLIECSNLYMNSDKYLSSLLLNRSISCNSSNPKVIIRSMVELIHNKKYGDVFNIAFRSIESMKFLAKSFKKNEDLSKSFLDFYKNSKIPKTSFSEEGSSLASLLYNNGAIFESLSICHYTFQKSINVDIKKKKEKVLKDAPPEYAAFYKMYMVDAPQKKKDQEDLPSNVADPIIARVYFLILLSQGLYKRFAEISKQFVTSLLDANDFDAFEFIGLRQFFEDYLSIIACKQRSKSINQNSFDQSFHDGFDLRYITDRQLAIIDCMCAMSSFLFMIGSCNEIGSFSNINPSIVKDDNDIPFWQIRRMFSIIRPISETLPAFDTSQQSVMLFGDESALMASYQIVTIIRPNNHTNETDQNTSNNDKNQKNKNNKDKSQVSNDQNNKNPATTSDNYFLLPNIIIDLSIWMLRKGHKCGQKKCFWTRIDMLDKPPLLVLELGCVDCEHEIPKLIRKNRFQEIGDAIDAVIEVYIQVIRKIKRKLPNTIIVIHPAIASNSLSSPLVFEFNRKLNLAASQIGVKFISIFAKYGALDMSINMKTLIKYRTSLRKYLIFNSTD